MSQAFIKPQYEDPINSAKDLVERKIRIALKKFYWELYKPLLLNLNSSLEEEKEWKHVTNKLANYRVKKDRKLKGKSSKN